MNFKNPEGQTARWIEILGIYDLEVEHRQGQNHGNADGLSRCPCSNRRYCERNEMRDQPDQEGGVQEGPEEGDEEYRCSTAVKVNEDPVAEKDAETGRSSWLLALTDVQIREAQLSDPCLSAVIKR